MASLLLTPNPIVLKEFLQAARRRRTFLIRAALPAVGLALLLPQLVGGLERYGQDWQATVAVVRPLFTTCAWLGLIGLSLLAFADVTAAFHEEWDRGTFEILCVAPLTRRQIVHGKYLASLGRVLLLGLALVPVMGIWFYLGRIPREMAVSSLSVIGGTVLLCASLALAQAAAFRPRRALPVNTFAFVLPWFLVLLLLERTLPEQPSLLKAITPWTALDLVLGNAPPVGYTTQVFAFLGLAVSAAVSAAAVGAAPVLFGWTLRRHLGVTGAAGGRRRLAARLLGVSVNSGIRRPRIPDWGDPLSWMERGRPTRGLRWALWAVWGVAAAVVYGAEALSEPSSPDTSVVEFLKLLSVTGLVVLAAVSAFYGAAAFAREKTRRTAEALLLTGHTPIQFYFAKVRALYRALRFSIPAVAAATIAVCVWNQYDRVASLVLVELALFGPAAALLLAMAFSVAARSTFRALVGLASTAGWVAAFVGLMVTLMERYRTGDESPLVWFVIYIIPTILLLAIPAGWTPGRLGLLLALAVMSAFCLLAAMVDAVEYKGYYWGVVEQLLFWVGSALAWLVVAGWTVLGLWLFDEGMAGGRPTLYHRRARRLGFM